MKAEIISITRLNEKELLELSDKMLLSLDLIELKIIQDYFKKLKREPTDIELETIAQTWSEHCKHKVFNSKIYFNDNGKEKIINGLFNEFIKGATEKIQKKVKWLVSVFHDNAGIISFNKDFDLAFKVETHNHPSALDPYGGANTGIGGVVRDILGCGLAAKPIANTDVFCFADPFYDKELPESIMHPKRIFKGVRAGVRDYGNRLGIPTVNGAIFFDERFLGNPLVYCGTVGIIPKGMHEKKVYDKELIVVLGGRTGRDGIHGATFASADLKEGIGTAVVQIGNAIEEKKVIDVILKARDEKLFTFITDCGAGGFSSAIGESAASLGARVYLEKAPLKYKGLKPWEIWVSESQERMVLAVFKENLERLKELCEIEEVELTVLGEYTKTGKLEVFHEKTRIVDLDLNFLHEGLPRKTMKAEYFPRKEFSDYFPEESNYNKMTLNILSMKNIASKESTVRQYDHEVQGQTISKPFIGVNNDGPSDAAIIWPDFNDNKAVVIANGINPWYGDINPYWMAASNIDEAIRNIVAVGGSVKKIALLDNFSWGNPNDRKKLGELSLAVKACYDFAVEFNAPFISGKDSFYNEFKLKNKTISVPGTLLISALGVLEDINLRQSMFFKKPNESIYIVGKTFNELGGSAYLNFLNIKNGFVPKVNARTALSIYRKLNTANKKGLINAIHDLSDGGLITALTESAFSGMLGFKIDLRKVLASESITRNDILLFSESNSRFIVEVKKGKEKLFEKIMKKNTARIGKTVKEKRLKVTGLQGKEIINLNLKKARNAWRKPLKW